MSETLFFLDLFSVTPLQNRDRERESLQGSQHVARRDAVDADAGLGPLDAERGAQVPDGSLGCVVGPAETHACQKTQPDQTRPGFFPSRHWL